MTDREELNSKLKSFVDWLSEDPRHIHDVPEELMVRLRKFLYGEEEQKPMTHKEQKVFTKALNTIHADDPHQYKKTLWEIVEILGGKEAVELQRLNGSKEFVRYVG